MENSSHKYFPEIDILRACACLLVAIVHFSVPNWVNGIADPNLLERLIISVVQTGWIGVPLFLFISGYSLAINKTAPGYALNTKQFFINRVLRILPLWIVCLLILKWSHKLTGGQFVSLLFLNMQDIPPANAFNISWSIQLEFFCYLAFPMLLAYLNDFRQLALVYATLIAIKIIVCGVPAQMAWELSYATVFGEITIFLTGMLVRRFIESGSPWKERIRPYTKVMFVGGIALFIGLTHFINIHGGWQAAAGRKMAIFFLMFPEMCAIIFTLITVPVFLRFLEKPKLSIVGKVFAHMGKVSYSAYLFSLFVHDFAYALLVSKLQLLQPGGWVPYGLFTVLYLGMLFGFSTLTFYTIEKPFLSKRKKY